MSKFGQELEPFTTSRRFLATWMYTVQEGFSQKVPAPKKGDICFFFLVV